MSQKTTTEGVREVSRGRGDRRFIKGNVGARTEPKLPFGEMSLWRFSEGQRYTLFLSREDAYDLADALDAMLAYIEANEEVCETDEDEK